MPSGRDRLLAKRRSRGSPVWSWWSGWWSASAPAPRCFSRSAWARRVWSSTTFCNFLRRRLLGLFLPFIFFLRSPSSRFALRAASSASSACSRRSSRTALGVRRTPPTASGSSWIISGASLSRSWRTSASRFPVRVSKGLATKVSKLGSPAPGTSIVDAPSECPTPSTSSYGQKASSETRAAFGRVCVMYGAAALAASASAPHTWTCGPCPTASSPRCETASAEAGVREK
mmetsp:Transcript_23008/g.74985  ORF Transcript_23008/g.74985 Transcript_23008/m.74985 type:complete len:230 (+) Transcript_23008:49-738(+)